MYSSTHIGRGLPRPITDRNVGATIGLIICLLLALVPGCIHSPNFVPDAITRTDGVLTTQPDTIPVELPHRGIPAFLLGTSADPIIAVLDTGASANLVSPEFAQKHHLETRTVPNLRIVDALGEKRSAPHVAHIDNLSIGSLAFHDFDTMVDPSVRAMDSHVDVMLGAPLFENVLLTIDYARRRIVLEPGGSLPPVNNEDILPLRTTKDGHLEIPAKLLGEDAWLILDTGHTGDGLTLSRYRLIALPWASTPVEAGQVQTMLGRHALRAGRMDGDITLGQFILHRPIVSIGWNDNDEMIGADTLRHFIVTIDQQHNRIRFRTPSDSNVVDYPPVRRLGFNIIDNTGTIEVTPQSEAAKAGLRPGDKLVSVNNIPIEKWSYRAYEYLERQGQAMQVHIRREGKDITLNFPPTVVIP